jgi:hypothetical protein
MTTNAYFGGSFFFRMVKSVCLRVTDPDFATLGIIAADPGGRTIFGLGL